MLIDFTKTTMQTDKKNIQFLKKIDLLALLVFFLPFLYWVYLYFSTTINIKYDAATYEELGTVIHLHGWRAFFFEIPDKMILYPFTIAVSMDIAQWLGASYQNIQKIIQILTLLLSQFLLFRILTKLQISRKIILAAVLYFGLSPAIVNSTFSLYAEIFTYPLILGIILCFQKAWEKTLSSNTIKIFLWAAALGLLFAFLCLIRALYEYVLIFSLAVVFIISLQFLITKKPKIFASALLLIITAYTASTAILMPYKIRNFESNGHKRLTLTGIQSFYETAAGRTADLSQKQILILLANTPGEGVCEELFSHQECMMRTWYGTSDPQRMALRSQGLSEEEIDHKFKTLAFESIFRNPFQYGFLTFAEGLKLLFWESTKIGYVNYPPWLFKLFDATVFKNGLRLVIFMITAASLLYSLFLLIKRSPRLLMEEVPPTTHFLFFLIMLILFTIVLYAPHYVNTRYAFSIVPLYFIMTAIACDELFRKK